MSKQARPLPSTKKPPADAVPAPQPRVSHETRPGRRQRVLLAVAALALAVWLASLLALAIYQHRG